MRGSYAGTADYRTTAHRDYSLGLGYDKYAQFAATVTLQDETVFTIELP